MRTTIDIPDRLLKKAKLRALEENVPLKTVFIRLLKKEFEGEAKDLDKAPWKALKGTFTLSDISPEESTYDNEDEELPPPNDPIWQTK